MGSKGEEAITDEYSIRSKSTCETDSSGPISREDREVSKVKVFIVLDSSDKVMLNLELRATSIPL